MKCSTFAQSQLTLESDQLKKQLSELKQELATLKFQYQSLEEDFLHALKGNPSTKSSPSLKGKKIVYIGGHDQSIEEYTAVTKRYQAELITPINNSYEAVCQAIEIADEVVCPADCQNQELCNTARSSSTKYNKPLRIVEDSSPQILQQKLHEIANISIQVQ